MYSWSWLFFSFELGLSWNYSIVLKLIIRIESNGGNLQVTVGTCDLAVWQKQAFPCKKGDRDQYGDEACLEAEHKFKWICKKK